MHSLVDSGPIHGTLPRTDRPATPRPSAMPMPAENDPDWRNSAACRDVDPELFFPIGNTGIALLQIEDAKSVCRGCVVQGSCLTWAMDTKQEFGVWGNASEDERRTMRRRESRERAAAAKGSFRA